MATKPDTSSTQFLPEVFRTEPNRQVLSSSLDVLTSQPDFVRVEGFIGNKYGYAVEGNDRYVVEPTKIRADYQLSPSLVFLKPNTQTARDFIDYPGLLDALKNNKSATNNPNRLFEGQFYSWDSFTNIDMIVNYTQYYWLPLGPDAVQVTGAVESDVIGRATYTSPNGITFINGLKVVFGSSSKEYYVEGVGTRIELIPVSELAVVEDTGGGIYNPWDESPWSSTGWDIQLYVPVTPEYITINRNSRDRNAWSRGNRWFSQNVIDTVIAINGQLTTNELNILTRAQRPIIQFEGNLSLWNSGTISAGFANYIDTTTTDPFSTIVGQTQCVLNQSQPSISITAENGAYVVFAADGAPADVKKNVYAVSYVPAGVNGEIVVALTPVPGVSIINGSQVYVISGPGDNEGTAWRWSEDTTSWIQGQKKTLVNQPPLFDIFDGNGQSIALQPNSSFRGTKLFSYTPGVGPNDPVLGFPISYSSVSNIGDINFDINLNSDTYTTGIGPTLSTKMISDGFVHYSPVFGTIVPRTGWVDAVAPSVQYQVFTSVVTEDNQLSVECDVLIDNDSLWAPIQIYVEGEFVDSDQYIVSANTQNNTTTVFFNNPLIVGQGISVLMQSKQTSPTAYYTIPDNLQNNPFNTNITQASMGDIRGHYSSIFINAPGLTGEQFGTNNFNDAGDLTSYGTSIIQNSVSLALPMTFARHPDYNLIKALRYNSAEYTDYKNTIVDIAYSEDYSVYQSPADILDSIIFKITAAKSQDESFFWSDMIPSGSPYASNTYSFDTNANQTICPLGRVYDFESANYYGVLVYLVRTVNKRVTYTQLIRGVDYVVSQTEPSLTVNYTILAGDKIQVKEYNQTYGSYIPNTPTKLGLYKATLPKVYTDNTYTQPTQFIVGHDGSYNKLYGDYINGQLNDFRDIALLEFETRVYNNLKWKGEIPLQYVDLFPGEFRSTGFTRTELMPLYSQNFLNWVGSNRIDYKTQVYSKNDQFTYNYNKAGDKLQGIALNATTPLQQGYWRGIYLWFYDTTNPANAPWEMLGFTDKPTWWEAEYGTAPYLPTNDMWLDLRDGRVRDPLGSYIEPTRVRPQLLSVLPVDDAGNLRPPLESVVSSFDDYTFNRGWIVGDVGPAEASYLKSSQWPFDLMTMLATFRPAKFYNLFADRDLYKYNEQFNQYLYKDRYHLEPGELTIYGNGTSKNSYINWVVDYINQTGTDGGSAITTTLQNIDVRLTYRLAGFSDKQYLKFLIERSTPTSNTPRLLIPDDSYQILLYDNVPSDRIEYSSVIIQRTKLGWTVWGNSLDSAYFTVLEATPGPLEKITVNNTSVEVSTTYRAGSRNIVAYGTEFYSLQGVAQFLRAYGRCQAELGVIFDNIKDGVEVDWTLMIKEFVAWATQGWEIGSTISVNPNATLFNVYRPGLIVQPLTVADGNFVLNQNLIPISQADIAVLRNNEEFTLKVLSVGDAVAYTSMNLSSVEHAVIFDNTTTFNDTIYQLTTGLRQNRIVMSGNKTALWSGYINANGFVMNEGDIKEWTVSGKYAKGQIVIYKDNYWSANVLSEPQESFDYTQWTQIDYEKVKVGLLPNPTTQAYEAEKFYNIYYSNLERDQDLLAFGLVGFRPRQYMVDAELSDITQVNVYLNMIPEKGTNLIANAFKNARLIQGEIDYDVRENWAIKNGEFGGVMNNNFVELGLSQSLLSGNPSIIGFTSPNVTTVDTNEIVDISNFINYGRKPRTANFLPRLANSSSLSRGLPTAGYVNIADVKLTAYEFEDLNLTPGDVDSLYTSDYVWIANYRGSWAVMQPVSVGTTIVSISNNLDGTITVLFDGQHGLVKNDAFAIVNFDSLVNGFFTVTSVSGLNSVVVQSDLSKSVTRLVGNGIALKLVSRRFAQASDAQYIQGTQFSTRLSWIDDIGSGDWQVLAAGTTYEPSVNTTFSAPSLGVGVAYTTEIGYLSADGAGKLYRNGVDTGLLAGSGPVQLVAHDNTVFCSDPDGDRVFRYTLNANILTLTSTINIVNTGAIAVSSDFNWLYVADSSLGTVSVFMLNAGTYTLVSTLIGASGESFGHSIATSIDGGKLIVGAPAKSMIIDGISEANVGAAYIYARGNRSFMSDGVQTSFDIDDSSANTVLVYINSVRDTSATCIAGIVTVTSALNVGDIVTVQWGTLVLQRELISEWVSDESLFGQSVTTNRYGAQIIVGVPYELDRTTNSEGAAYVYTNAGQLYGTIIATPVLPITLDTTIYIDGYEIFVPATTSSLEVIAEIIENGEPTNVTATVSGNSIIISTIAQSSDTPYNIIDIVGKTSSDLQRMGISAYDRSQIIRNPDLGLNTAFGWTVAMNSESSSARDSVVVAAPTGTVLAATTFDYSDNLNSDDTIFDNGATTFNDSFVNAGSAYQFDYLSSLLPSTGNPGKFVFGQYCVVPNSANSSTELRSLKTGYGNSLYFNDGAIVIGSPTWYTDARGRVDVFKTTTEVSSWYTHRKPATQVDINLLNNISIYNTETNSDLDFLDYIDPVQGKMLSAVETNIDFICDTDPAGYTTGIVWGEAQVGKTWLNTSNLRMMNYHQGSSTGVPDNLYNSQYWGVAFPGSTADIFTWISSEVAPINYAGLGFVVSIDNYTSSVVLDAKSDTLVERFYFWVKDYTAVPQNKTLSPSVLNQYILNPVASGVAFLAPLATNAIALYNCGGSIQSNSSALHLGYGVNVNGDTLHSDWSLIQVGTSDSFLEGVPLSIEDAPSGMYLKYLNSFMGGEVVNSQFLTLPDTSLPVLVRYGTQFRPRQTMFVDRISAIKNYVDYANSVLSMTPITETRGTYLINQQGILPVPYNVRNYWTETDWWASGYSSSTKVTVEVQTYTDLLTLGQSRLASDVSSDGLLLTLTEGLVARVADNGHGQSETYIYGLVAGWTRIGLQNGTVELKSTLYTDTTTSASMAVYWVIRWLTEQVFTNDMSIENNNLLIMMFNLIQSQSIQQNNYLPWLNKTSLIDVGNIIRALRPYKKFQRDNQELVEGYINEVKPYHVYIKSYTLKYTALDDYSMTMTDFDLPAKFNTRTGTYISPQLIYSGASGGSQYLPTSEIWSEPEYTDWFNNYGLSVSNSEVEYLSVTKLVQNNILTTLAQPVAIGNATITLSNVVGIAQSGIVIIKSKEVPYSGVNYLTGELTLLVLIDESFDSGTDVTVLTPELSTSQYVLQVQSTEAMPDFGTIRIDSELMFYNGVDRANNILTGVIRGFNNTVSTVHSATAQVYLQTSPVMVVSTGRGYVTPPTITAQIDTQASIQQWVSGTVYVIGDKVIYNGAGWICISANANANFNALNWNQIEIFPAPRVEARFVSTIIDGKLTNVTVTNAGDGYAAMPDMIVQPSPITAQWTSSQMDTVVNQIYINGHSFVTGDSVVFGGNTTAGTPLELGGYYWVNKINANTIALYYSYDDAINGWSTPSPASATVNAIVDRVLTMSDRVFTTGSRVKLVNTLGQFYYYWVGLVSLDPTSTDIALYNTLEDALNNDILNRVVPPITVGNTITNIQMTDDTRVTFDVATGGKLSVTAIVRAYTNEQPVREIKVNMKFDRTSYRYDQTDINAIWRIEQFYKPKDTMPGFKINDYSQLMSGTGYGDVNLIDPSFNFGSTYSFDSSDVNVVQNTINLSPLSHFVNPVEMLFIETPINGVYSTTFGLVNRNSYWFRSVPVNAPTTVAVYYTSNDAAADINRISLNTIAAGQFFTGDYNSVVVTSQNNPYEIFGGTFGQGHAPEELVAGLITDTVNLTVTSTPGGTWAPDITAMGLTNSNVMANTGFNMYRFTSTPGTVRLKNGSIVSDAIYFGDRVPNPTTLALYADASLYSTALPNSTRRLTINEFTVDWVNKVILITNPLVSASLIEVDLYEFGNGLQLIRSNSTIYPMRTVMTPVPHTEILLDVPYQSGPNISGVELPSQSNYWETVAVFLNGQRVLYNDVNLPTPVGYTLPKFTVQPTRTLDQVNDPYNPAKLVFDGLLNPNLHYVSFAVTTDNNVAFTSAPSNTGLSIPETQWFTNLAGSGVQLELTSFLGDDNLSIPSDNVILEINGQRYLGSAPFIQQYIASDEILAYAAPVYDLSTYNVVNMVVQVNGVVIPPSPTTWLDNYDIPALTLSGLDADFGLLYGYFDDGIPFDSNVMLAVVFDSGYLTPGDIITISYNSALLPDAFNIVPNANMVGGVMTINVPLVSTDVVSVTTFNRTTQQSLVTQSISNATVSQIANVVEQAGLPVEVTTSLAHNLQSGDYVTINGGAAVDLDGGRFYVNVVDPVTVTLWSDALRTIPVEFSNASPLIAGQTSFIQEIRVNTTTQFSLPLAINQPIYTLSNPDRLWVTVIRPGVPGVTPDLRDYVDNSKVVIANNTLVLMQEIQPTDIIILTSTVPTASPSGTRFRINMDKYNGLDIVDQSAWGILPWDSTVWSPPSTATGYISDRVFRENQQTRTYVTENMTTTSQMTDTLVAADPYRLVKITTRLNQVILSGATNHVLITGINSRKLTSITVNESGTMTPVVDFITEIVNLNSVRLTFNSTPVGTAVDVTMAIGNQLMVQSEQIKFSTIDLMTGEITGLMRGVNGTIVNPVLFAGSELTMVDSTEELNPDYYDQSWYNAMTDNIPLQLSDSAPATFLNTVF